jgi:hypothetical protein
MKRFAVAIPLAAALGALAHADTETPGHQADLYLGPLIGGQEMILQVQSSVPNAPLFAIFGFGFQPTVPSDPAIPVIGVFPPNSFLQLTTDAKGGLRLLIPTVPGQFPIGTGLVLRMQVLLLNQDAKWVSSQVRASELAPAGPLPFGSYADQAATRLPPGYDVLGAIEAAAVDVDRDGYIDVTLITPNDVVQWKNDGLGKLVDVSAAAISHPGDALSALTHGDVDGDGAPDLVTAGGFETASSPPDRLYVNDGSGHFSNQPGFPGGLGLTFDLEFGDVDKDGDLDLITAVQPEPHLATPGGTDQLYRNNGFGGFSVDAGFAGALWNEPLTDTRGIELGDVDRDGDLDVFLARSDTLAVVGTSGERNVLLLGNGSGDFSDASATNLPALFDNSQDVELADLDADGDLDAVVANSVFTVSTANSGDVLFNVGGKQGGTEGIFVDNPQSFLEPFSLDNGIRMSANAADLEGDGDLDVLVTVHDGFINGTQQLLFRNGGGSSGGIAGAFAQDPLFDPADAIISGAALFDLEGDGDVDILLPVNGVITGDPAQQFQTRLMINTYL